MKKIIRILFILFFITLLFYSGYKIFRTYAEYKKAETVTNHIINQVVSLQSIKPTTTPSATYIPQDYNDSPDSSISIEIPITVDFDKLYDLNSDIIGWMYCEDTVINYPIVQGNDNIYYLNHLYSGQYSKSGSLFMDYRCDPDYLDKNTLIYGHHMKSGSMFASLVKYQTQDYYDMHSVMFLLTPSQNYLIELFSGYITDADSKSFTIRFNSEFEFDSFLTSAHKKSDFKNKVTATSEDKLITLSTCTYEYPNARYVVHGLLKEIN